MLVACTFAAVRPGELAGHSRSEPGCRSDTRWLAVTMPREDGTVRKRIPPDPTNCVRKSTSPEPDPKEKALTATLTLPETRGEGTRGKLLGEETVVSTHCGSPI